MGNSGLADKIAESGGIHVKKDGTKDLALWYTTGKRGSCR